MKTHSSMQQAFADIFAVGAPYDFQLRVAELLLSGQDVILQAPTGAGKTKAALFPYLLARQEGIAFPQKLLYTVPMRVLARSFYSDLSQSSTQKDVDARLQTGEQQDDPKLEGEVIFATIDQVLSSFLNIPYSLSQRQGNINAGAVASSYLVFDEFHLLDPASSLPTTLEMLRMLKGVAPFLLMTATFSSQMLHRLAALLNAEVITLSDAELQRIPSQRDKERRLYLVDNTLTADAVLAHHQHRSIAICNTVERAQNLFLELRDALSRRGQRDTRVILLHARFLQAHRQGKEDEVRRAFGKGHPKTGSVILVATQVIEVGLDITCEVMHTEVAPASALLQRAGRCARFAHEEGEVYVYQVPSDKNEQPNYAPYTGKSAKLSQQTWQALPGFHSCIMDFPAEQELVNQVHGEADSLMLDELEQARYARRQSIIKTMTLQEIGGARELIRNDDSVRLVVHPYPSQIQRPYDLESFSLFFGTVHSQLRQWRAAGLPNQEIPWLLQYPQEKDDTEAEDRPARYQWAEIVDERALPYAPLLAVNPRLADYHPDIGFRLVPGAAFQSPLSVRTRMERVAEQEGYRRESYHEHIQKMLRLFDAQLWKDLQYPAARLEQQMGLPSGLLREAIRLAIALHDVGKLDQRWQGWAHEWQQRIQAPVGEDEMLAHTDYDPDSPVHLSAETAAASRPRHAAEGAVAASRILHQLLGAPAPDEPRFKLFKAAFSAIVRHHSPQANKYRTFALHPNAIATLAQLLSPWDASGKISQDLIMSKHSQPLTSLLVQADARDELLAYFFIVRALRLADQRAMLSTNE